MAEYIDRERAIQKVRNVMATEWFRGNNAAIEPLQRVVDVQLGRMTAADVAPVVHGRWIDVGERYDDYDECFYSVFKCSNCGTTKEEYPTSNYCPNCGAKMDIDEEGDM